MKKQRGMRGLALLAVGLLLMLLAACGGAKDGANANGADGSGDGPPVEQEQPVKLLDQAHVLQKEGNRLLVTAYANRDGNAFVDAYSLTLDADTVYEDSAGQTISDGEIVVGSLVEVWAAGPVMESYPAQTGASRVILHRDPAPEGTEVSRTEAVRAALASKESKDGWNFPVAVKRAEWDADNARWQIELIRHDAVDEPAIVNIDAESGRVIVAENDAFRIFAPEPGSELVPGFRVEGKARVFEAVFHWTLEDGHIILAEGMEMADGGAPAWGSFAFEVGYDKATQPNMMLVLYVHSAKDGSVDKELIVPFKVPEDRIDYSWGVESGEE